MDTSVAFVIDTPRTLAEGATTSRVQVAKTGTFQDPRYGKFAITRADFVKWQTNFAVLSVGNDRAGLPIDVDHGPEKTGNTEAAGWILSLDTKGPGGKTDTPDELWAVAEWNSLGVELVGDHRYRYLSPSYLHDKKTEDGKSMGTALVGVGLTNRPFLTMATVSLSEAPLLAEQLPDEPVVPEASDSRRRMALTDEALKRLGLAEGATDEQISLAVAALAEPPKEKTLDQLAGENGKVVLDATEYGTLKAGADAGTAAAAELKATKFQAAWDKALDAGKVVPAQLENMTALYGRDAETTLTLLDGLQPVVHTTTKGRTGDPDLTIVGRTHAQDAEGDEVDADAAKVDTRAQAILAEGKVTDYQEAILMASAELGG